jgi:hypothetical protein
MKSSKLINQLSKYSGSTWSLKQFKLFETNVPYNKFIFYCQHFKIKKKKTQALNQETKKLN